MQIDQRIMEIIEQHASRTPEPDRATRNMERYLAALEGPTPLPSQLRAMAMLFSVSQFLANFCAQRPQEFIDALADTKRTLTRDMLTRRAQRELLLSPDAPEQQALSALRIFKKRYLLRITLRDVMRMSDVMTSMEELTALAEVCLEASLAHAHATCTRRYGRPTEGAGGLCLIGLGKMGGHELNYSSDLDLMAVYSAEPEGMTEGVQNPAGLTVNRITNQEYFIKLTEMTSRLLTKASDEGIVYRIDLRLRPQGQRGDLAMPLSGYRDYYQSIGRTWERLALVRARPVAGDMAVGEAFMSVVEDFTWGRPVGADTVEEIRSLKKKIDSTCTVDDIKRGYGGIREAEFFVQTFQLMHGAHNRPLRTCRLLNAIQGLRHLELVDEADMATLWEIYVFLRRAEHFLQMRDDLQVYKLPASKEDMLALARAMGFDSAEQFLSDLRVRRMKVKTLYNTLLGSAEDVHAESLTLLEGDLSQEELRGYLEFRNSKQLDEATSSMQRLREHMARGRDRELQGLLRRLMPDLLEGALASPSPDRGLMGLEAMLPMLETMEHDALSSMPNNRPLVRGIVSVMALSPMLTRLMLSDAAYIKRLAASMPRRKPLSAMQRELENLSSSEIGKYRAHEWLRLGMLFLSGSMPSMHLRQSLSALAEAMIRCVVARHGSAEGFAVIAMGKLGGREISFGSDLDMMFVAEGQQGLEVAQALIRELGAYSAGGKLYEVDTRLRPEGSKGPLVTDIAGYRKYYLDAAQGWEIQALTKARPVAGGRGAACEFMQMAREAIDARGRGWGLEQIRAMRGRIMHEHVREDDALDIKLGPGGLEEIEFHVQWLVLRHCGQAPRVLVQSTLAAIHRLERQTVLVPEQAMALRLAYLFYIKLLSFLKLNEIDTLPMHGEVATLAAAFMSSPSPDALVEKTHALRDKVLKALESLEVLL